VLIDEARTPLIISALPSEEQRRAVACYEWAAKMVDRFEEDVDYEYEHDKKQIELTYSGRQLLRSLPTPEALHDVGLVDLYEYIERAIKVRRDFHRDREYVVRDGEVVIVDESTGRAAWPKAASGARESIRRSRRRRESKSPSPPDRPPASPCRTCSCATSTWRA
jgi:preprotein translocase subunit SecA